jgi:hypothetical protein
MKSEMKKQSKIKKQSILSVLLAGMVLGIPIVTSQETTDALRQANNPTIGTMPIIHNNTMTQNTMIVNVPVINASQMIVQKPLIMQSKPFIPGLNTSEKDLLFFEGGFDGDGQKIIPVTEGAIFLIVCTIGYALVMRRKYGSSTSKNLENP